LATEWFAWQHEATVDRRYGNKVITFETINGSGENERALSTLLAPKQPDDTNIFVGFAPEGKNLPKLDDSLRNILPGRDAL
jgi:hypothetical protein